MQGECLLLGTLLEKGVQAVTYVGGGVNLIQFVALVKNLSHVPSVRVEDHTCS